MARVKICGLRREQDIAYVNKLKPDYAGFILSNGFKRSIDMYDVSDIAGHLSKDIKKVGVFVDEPLYYVETAIKLKAIDIVQLHGNETPEFCSQINIPVIKALKPENFDKISEYEPYVDYFLFDNGTGTGKVFDWSKIPECDKPFFLAGGLDKSNIKQAIETINPYAVDLSSSVETQGCKDYNKIKEIIDIVRSTQ